MYPAFLICLYYNITKIKMQEISLQKKLSENLLHFLTGGDGGLCSFSGDDDGGGTVGKQGSIF